MTEMAERYDHVAGGYAQWWAPVLVRDAVAILDDLEPSVEAGARRIVDIGTGTGTLALAALRRWPTVEVTGIDISPEMVRTAEAEIQSALGPAADGRFKTAVAPADDLPFDDEAFDLAMSSFVLQLVPNRYQALREVRRVLRAGGTLAYVTWLVAPRSFAPDDDLDTTLDEVGIGAREPETRSGDIPTVEAAAAQLRRAGFRDVRAEGRTLEHRFTAEGFYRFTTEFDEEDLVSSFDRPTRARFDKAFRARLGQRSAAELTLRYPIVRAAGRRP